MGEERKIRQTDKVNVHRPIRGHYLGNSLRLKSVMLKIRRNEEESWRSSTNQNKNQNLLETPRETHQQQKYEVN